MLRKSGLICLAAVLLWGCDLFSTREFRPKPSELRTLSGLSRVGDSLAFLVTEALWRPGAASAQQTLSVRRMVFRMAGDSLDAGDTLKILELAVRSDSTGELLESARRLVRFSSQGVILEGTATGGSARIFPIKVSAASATSASSEASLLSAAAIDSTSVFALPALLVEGWDETRAMGILQVRRVQTSIDTLTYHARWEEAWGVSETIMDGNTPLASGKYWYGASGLLKAELVWAGFDWRDANGSVPAGAASGSDAEPELRRSLVRL
jgi:hypothetical protein